jgi:hypothetical protein
MAMQMHLGERARASVSCNERGHQRQSDGRNSPEVIRGHQMDETHQGPSEAIRWTKLIRGHQRSSEVIRWTKLTLANALASGPACPS